MNVPQGRLRRQRVVTDLTTPLERALDDELTGYIRLEPQDTLLLDSEGAGVLTFDRGIPRLVYHTGTDNGGTAALTDIAVAGPCRVELYELDRDALDEIQETPELAVDPGAPAEQLAGDRDLACRTRERAPEDDTATDPDHDAVSAFLDDEERIAEIKDAARAEAQSRASDWGFDI
ncbi:hypothetical protein SAMN05216226_109150 [Halovenus aranensis]|uniref:DUF8054 domain-containing protein n=1 Tax=Halovenus aranensis TaxID=890420 RepID=A0A1G8WS59_9EURY|nr:hypothetical protein [Halovenus aranensis]SDJ80465.1 hypothetical protein SAMN05216226_109150 [Halovenus aranensis]